MIGIQAAISHGGSCSAARPASDVAPSASPIRSGSTRPWRVPSAPASGPAAIIAAENGSSVRPASVGLRLKSFCRKPGTSTKNAVRLKPTRIVLALVAAMPGRIRVGRSTSGSSTLRSIATHAASAAAATRRGRARRATPSPSSSPR